MPPSIRSVFVSGLILTVLSACPVRAFAGAPEADALVKEGIVLRRKGDDAVALRKFEEAYQMVKSPRTLAQIALAEQALGRWAAAHDHLVSALGAKDDVWIAKNTGSLTQALNMVAEHVGKLEILGGSPGAELRLNGVLQGTLPLSGPLTIATGIVTVDLSAPRCQPIQRAASVLAGQMTRESFDPLAPIVNNEAPVTPMNVVVAPGTIPTAAVPHTAPDAVPAAPDRGAPSSLRGSAKWVAGVAGVAGLATGTIAYLLHRSAATSFNGGCRINSATGQPEASRNSQTDASCRGLRATWDSDYKIAIVGFAAGAVLATAGVVLWLTEPKAGDGSAAAFAGCAPALPGPAGVGVGCSLRF